MSAFLPNAEKCFVPASKVRDYLLSFEHPDGGGKASFFARLGFTRANWPLLAAALRRHANDHFVASAVQSDYGWKYIIDGPITPPQGKPVHIRTIWIVEIGDPTGTPRLVTAYPAQTPKL